MAHRAASLCQLGLQPPSAAPGWVSPASQEGFTVTNRVTWVQWVS